MRAPVEIARALQLKPGETVVVIRRLLEFDGAPMVLEEISLPGVLFRGLSAERLNAYTGPLYGLLETEFGVRMIRASERVKAVAAGPDEARLLHVNPGEPLLLVVRVSSTYGDRPVEVRHGWYVTLHHHYANELN
jgi:GntR family transcriptional regulator